MELTKRELKRGVANLLRMRIRGNMEFLLFAVIVLLSSLPPSQSSCALYGCTSSLSYTCPTDFWGPFLLGSVLSYQADEAKPTGAGCVTNANKTLCPFAGNGK